MMGTVVFNSKVCNLMPTLLAVLSLNKVFRRHGALKENKSDFHQEFNPLYLFIPLALKARL